MDSKQLESLRYPIGRFQLPENPSVSDILKSIATIESFPARLEEVVTSLSNDQLNTPYRPEGWTIREVVHHVGDSHMNALVRFKWGLTEDRPTIKTYAEGAWVQLADAGAAPVGPSIDLLKALHKKWTLLLKGLKPEQWERTIFHPGFNKEISLAQLVSQYAWHCRHHLAHVTVTADRKGWR